MVKWVWILYRDCMGHGTFYGDFMVELIWRLSGNLIFHVFSIKTTD